MSSCSKTVRSRDDCPAILKDNEHVELIELTNRKTLGLCRVIEGVGEHAGVTTAAVASSEITTRD